MEWDAKKGNWRVLPELGGSCFVLGVSIPAPIKFMIFSICLKRTDNSYFNICLTYQQLLLGRICLDLHSFKMYSCSIPR